MIERRPNTEYILSLSYGKDSIACLFAIEQLRWPLDRIVHAEVWATDTIPADLPPMVEFKKKADAIIEKRWGIKVEHISTKTYEHFFYISFIVFGFVFHSCHECSLCNVWNDDISLSSKFSHC